MASLGIYKSDLIVSGDRKEKGNKSQLRQPVGGVGWGGVEGDGALLCDCGYSLRFGGSLKRPTFFCSLYTSLNLHGLLVGLDQRELDSDRMCIFSYQSHSL